MSVQGKGSQVIVLEWTTEDQLKYIKQWLDKMYQGFQKEMGDKYGEEWLDGQVTDSEEYVYHGLCNFLADLEVEGYEMS